MTVPKSILDNLIDYHHEYSKEPHHCDYITIVYYKWALRKEQTFRFARVGNKISSICITVLEQLQDAKLEKYGSHNIKKFKIVA